MNNVVCVCVIEREYKLKHTKHLFKDRVLHTCKVIFVEGERKGERDREKREQRDRIKV